MDSTAVRKSLKSFTLVELLVSMAIIAILLGISIYGINIVQRSARDVLRMKKVDEVDLVLTSCLGSGKVMTSFFRNGGTTSAGPQVGGYCPDFSINLPGITQRGTPDAGGNFFEDTTTQISDYCISVVDNTSSSPRWVVGVMLESGNYYYKSNSGASYSSSMSFPATASGFSCWDQHM